MPSMTLSARIRSILLSSVLLPGLLLSGGCTMCPDPFDYSGPVPNGSVTQNDFAARSNGTRPVRATPFPWPPFVDASGRRPTPADEPDTTVLVAAEAPLAPAAPLGAVVAEVDAAEESPAVPPVDDDPTSVAVVAEDAPNPAPVRVAPGVVPPRGAWMTRDRRLPPPGNVAPPAERRPSTPTPETSGWRAAARSVLGR